MKHAATRDLYCYWDALRGSRSAPERVDIDPGAIRRVLGDTFILEVDDNGEFPFRLAGTRICALLGHELRGTSSIDPFFGTDRAEIRRLLRGVCDDSAAIVVGIDALSSEGQALELELLLLPLRHRGQTHSRILGSLTPSTHPYWVGTCPLVSFEIKSMRVMPQGSRDVIARAEDTRPLPEGMRRVGHLTVVDGGRA